jgi:hypothetical protein
VAQQVTIVQVPCSICIASCSVATPLLINFFAVPLWMLLWYLGKRKNPEFMAFRYVYILPIFTVFYR